MVTPTPTGFRNSGAGQNPFAVPTSIVLATPMLEDVAEAQAAVGTP